jgi:hypothetical protein
MYLINIFGITELLGFIEMHRKRTAGYFTANEKEIMPT